MGLAPECLSLFDSDVINLPASTLSCYLDPLATYEFIPSETFDVIFTLVVLCVLRISSFACSSAVSASSCNFYFLLRNCSSSSSNACLSSDIFFFMAKSVSSAWVFKCAEEVEEHFDCDDLLLLTFETL